MTADRFFNEECFDTGTSRILSQYFYQAPCSLRGSFKELRQPLEYGYKVHDLHHLNGNFGFCGWLALRLWLSHIRFSFLLLSLVNVSSSLEVRAGELTEVEEVYPAKISELSQNLRDVKNYLQSPSRSLPTDWDFGMVRMGEVAANQRALPVVKPEATKSIGNVLTSVAPLAPEKSVTAVRESLDAAQVPAPRIADSMSNLGSRTPLVGKSNQDSLGAIAPKESQSPAETLEDAQSEIERLMKELAEKSPEDMKFEDYILLKKLLASSLGEVKELLPRVEGFTEAAERLISNWAKNDATGDASATQARIELLLDSDSSKTSQVGQIHQGKKKSRSESHK